ncbi:MAG: hypothetical protein J07HQX50_01834 [Haloquadratum sp. J07HQX50]|nr:MAG: hypothetical protein J07HQX50_01834 [Haloquadratum sp. J07HQX50]
MIVVCARHLVDAVRDVSMIWLLRACLTLLNVSSNSVYPSFLNRRTQIDVGEIQTSGFHRHLETLNHHHLSLIAAGLGDFRAFMSVQPHN